MEYHSCLVEYQHCCYQPSFYNLSLDSIIYFNKTNPLSLINTYSNERQSSVSIHIQYFVDPINKLNEKKKMPYINICQC